jgi:translation initiation factor 2B subunit (eIF-2B alpha/beta/delta family)
MHPGMTRLAPTLLVLLAFVMASCGGDDAPTREEYAESASEICREAEQSLDEVTQDAETPQEVADAVDQVSEESRHAVEELADLERPEGEAGEAADRFVNATRTEIQEKGIPVLEDLRDALADGDEQAAQDAAQRLQEIDSDASNRAARELGAEGCGEE